MRNEFSSDDRIVCTYYFNWYDVRTNEHIVVGNDRDYLSSHPTPYCLSYDKNPNYRLRERANMDGCPTLSYMNTLWHHEELTRMADVGIDICFFDYWHGFDTIPPNSRASLATLASILTEGAHLPAIAMFIETIPFGTDNGGLLAGLDLTTVEGGDRLFSCVDAFFSLVPAHAVAKIDGRALAMFYTSSVKGLVPGARGLHRCKKLFRNKYGYGLTFIGNKSWKAKCKVEITYTCAWGAVRHANRLQQANFTQIGPGYNYRGESRGTPPSPEKFKEAWVTLRKNHTKFVAIETWNEFHESTGIAPTLEYGDKFINIARNNIKLFKEGK